MLLRLTVVGSLLISLAPVAAAQSDPPLLPTPLVSALMAGQQYGAPRDGQYFVGTTPTGFPAVLVPRSATVAGGMSSGVLMVAVFADTARRFLADYIESLSDSGWTQPAIEPGAGFQSWGGGRSSYFCRDSSRVSAIAVPGALVGAFIHVTYQRADPASCLNRNRFGISPRAASLLDLPLLLPPKGMQSTGAGSSSGNSDMSTHVRLIGDTLSTSAVLAHYARLLVAAGWTTEAPATAATIGAQALRARDKEGKTWLGWILVSVDGPARNAAITMRRTDTR
jgi:hypothetical protein